MAKSKKAVTWRYLFLVCSFFLAVQGAIGGDEESDSDRVTPPKFPEPPRTVVRVIPPPGTPETPRAIPSSRTPVPSRLSTKAQQRRAVDEVIDYLMENYGQDYHKEDELGLTFEGLREKYHRLVNEAKTLEENEGLRERTAREILSPVEMEQLLIGLGAEYRDGHLSVARSSRDVSTVGLYVSAVRDSDGYKLVVVGVNPHLFQKGAVPFDITTNGTTEVVAVNGRPVMDIARENMLYEGSSTYSSGVLSALEAALIVPHSHYWPKKEGAPVEVTFRQGDQIHSAQLNWSNRLKLIEHLGRWGRIPLEQSGAVENVTQLGETYAFGYDPDKSYFRFGIENLIRRGEAVELDIGLQVNQKIYERLSIDAEAAESIGIIERLSAYTVELSQPSEMNVRIGVLRIPDFHPEGGIEEVQKELLWIRLALKMLESHSDVLVIDQSQNRGGYVDYVMRFLSFFATEELESLTSDPRLSVEYLDNAAREASFKGGNFAEIRFTQQNRDRIAKAAERGDRHAGDMPFLTTVDNLPPSGTVGKIQSTRVSDPVANSFHLLEVDERYTFDKPVVVLTDPRCASGSEFVAQLFQMNRRGVVVGEPTSGAMAPVMTSSTLNSGLTIRAPFAVVKASDGQSNENIGAQPDIRHPIVRTDLLNGFMNWSSITLEVAASVALNSEVGHVVPSEEMLRSLEAELTQVRAQNLGARSGSILPNEQFYVPLELLNKDRQLSYLNEKGAILDRLQQMLRLWKFRKDVDPAARALIKYTIAWYTQEKPKSPNLRAEQMFIESVKSKKGIDPSVEGVLIWKSDFLEFPFIRTFLEFDPSVRQQYEQLSPRFYTLEELEQTWSKMQEGEARSIERVVEAGGEISVPENPDLPKKYWSKERRQEEEARVAAKGPTSRALVLHPCANLFK